MNRNITTALLLCLYIIGPIAFAFLLLHQEFQSVSDIILSTVGIIFYLWYIFTVGRWDMINYYLRYCLLAFILIVLVIFIPSIASNKQFLGAIGLQQLLSYVVNLLLLALFSPALFCCYTRSMKSLHTIIAEFPLNNGIFYLAQGGNCRFLNHHYTNPAQKYGMDIVQLAPMGFRARGIYPEKLDQYFIYGQTVFCPIDGTIVTVVNNLLDQTPPKRDRSNALGNYVIIQHDINDVYIILAHLQKNSICVREKERVIIGQPLAKVGNSGNSSEPHLHIHCAKGKKDILPLGGEGIAICFGYKHLKRNRLIRRTSKHYAGTNS